MNSFRRSLNILLVFFVTVSCGGKPNTVEDNLYLKAKEELNSRNYSKSNVLFEKLVLKNPSNRKYQQGLADTLLGMGGFELFDFLLSIERIIGSSFNSSNLLIEIKNFVEKYLFIDGERKNNLTVVIGR
jgi:hypothetical protein